MLRCAYVDIDGTLVGRGGSLFHDCEGAFSMRGARGIEACHRAGVEIVVFTGRREAQAREDARLIGGSAYICEVGCLLVADGDRILFTGGFEPRTGSAVYDQIATSGAPRLLMDHFRGRLEYHEPWHEGREYSHLLRGLVDPEEATDVLARHGHERLKLIDNGAIARRSDALDVARERALHAYHLIPIEAGKAVGVAAHMRLRGYSRDECIAVGDSREDMAVADVVGRFYLVANAVRRDAGAREAASGHSRVTVTEEEVGAGFYEAVVRTLAETRPSRSSQSSSRPLS